MKPNVEMDSSENISALINNGNIPVTYRPETDDSAEYSWPFNAAEKNGENCLKASNQKIDASFAILYADVELKAGEAIAFDYLISSELGIDVFHVIVDNEPIYSISGVQETESWVSCCPWVAEKDGTYEVALCYIKDEGTNMGDDTVYIKNMRVTDESEIDSATYLPRKAATTEDGFEFSYVDLVYSEKDGYYHLESADGPVLYVRIGSKSSYQEAFTTIVGTSNLGKYIYDENGEFVRKERYNEIFFAYAAAADSKYSVYPLDEDLYYILKGLGEIGWYDKTSYNYIFKEEEIIVMPYNGWLFACVYFK